MPATDWFLQPILAVDPAAAARLLHRPGARPERGPAAQPREDRHRRVTGSASTFWRSSDWSARWSAVRSWRTSSSRHGERAYAEARSRPAQHLAARFCAKEAVAKALGLRGWSFRDVEVVAGDGAALDPPERPRRGAGGRARGGGGRCRSPTRTGSRAPWRHSVSGSLPDWLDPLYEADEMRAVDAWAIEEHGRAVARPDGASRGRAGAGRRRPPRPTVRSAWWSARATTAATGSSAARLLREEGREVDVLAVGAAGRAARATRAANLERLPGRPAGAVRRRSGSRAPARSWTPCSAPASRASRASRSRARSRRSTRRSAGGGLRRAVRRERVDGRGGGRGRPARP